MTYYDAPADSSVFVSVSAAIQPVDGYVTESVRDGYLPCYLTLPLPLGRYSFPLRVEG